MKNLLLFLLLSAIIFTSCQDSLVSTSEGPNSHSESTTFRGDTENLCVASWNAQLLDVGDLFGGPQCEGVECRIRAKKLCEQVTKLLDPEPDVVNFQEVFEADAANALIQCMVSQGYSFHTGFDPAQNIPDCLGGIFMTGEAEGSGLITFSKFPIISTMSEDYEACNGCTGDANDCLADKAMLLTEIEVSPGCTIFNLNTHLDAGDSNEDMEAREKQLLQLKAFLDANVTGDSPLLISGDFNIKRNTPEYNTLLALLGNPDNVAALAGTVDGITSDSGTTLDYIFGQNINSATYKVYYQETACWWEYREEITTSLGGGPIAMDDIDIWAFDDDVNIHNQNDIKITVVVHKYDKEEDIPNEYKDLVIRVCRNVEKSNELAGQKCGFYLSTTIELNGGQGFFSFIDFYETYYDIPEELREYYIYDCTYIHSYNPSDHNPVLSCVEFDCE